MSRCLFGLVLAIIIPMPTLADEPKALPSAKLAPEEWMKVHTSALQPGEIDRLVNAELKKAGITPTPIVNDELFLRRVYIDLTGRLPMPADIKEFQNHPSPSKRAAVIDQLLDSDEFAKHWTRYWRNVIMTKLTDIRAFASVRAFDYWLHEQIKSNRSWGAITKEMLTASGEIRDEDPTKNGQLFFMVSRKGADAQTELTAEVSRIFLGIQIQCAQCHDHPSDVWKRQDFHQLAAYLTRVRERPIRDGMKFVGTQLVSLPFGEYQMPGTDNPKQTTTMQPKFIDGKAPGRNLSDAARRRALADAIISKDNPWFAAAFVNRIWGELMGQAFVSPIDDLGPQKDVMLPTVLVRVAASFRGSDYDMRALYRDILTSEMYQRAIRPGTGHEEHRAFAASNPTRMSADSLWQSLVDTLGKMDQGMGNFQPKGPGGFGRFGGLETTFKQEFGFDPSTKPEEVEGSIIQALILMNNPQIHQKIQATGTNLLARILASYPSDDEAIQMVYLRTLARRPSDRELARCKQHIQSIGRRTEAYEDLLWALINCTEYQTKR